MYRLVLYFLLFLLALAFIFGILGFLPYNPVSLAFTASFFVIVCWITNTIFAKTFKAPTNVESVYISALILALIVTPLKTFEDLPFFFWVGVWTIASKYIIAVNKKHIFNPVAFGTALVAFTIGNSATWWIGTPIMLPAVLIGGLLIARKIRRFDLVLTFIGVALTVIISFGLIKAADPFVPFQKAILETPLLFFAFIMLTEPLTTPPTRGLRIYYAALVGSLFAPQIHIGPIFSTPELVLIVGNIFSYVVSPKEKLMLKLKEKIKLSPDIYDFVFNLNKKLDFVPGQYMEWTFPHANPDSRGNRRYFTLASSPTESEVRIGVKFADQASSYKKSMLNMQIGDEIVAGQRSGDFTLPKNPSQKLVFVAGGIGVTPFRSIIKYLIDTNQKRDIVIFYTTHESEDLVYKDIFDEAQEKLAIKTIYVATESGKRIDADLIKKEVPDYNLRMFYISGSHGMVTGFKDTLSKMGIPNSQIKVDYFPGFA